ncbi:MAG: STAS domain-containing protein [Pseudomonadota bacterium]
MSDNEHISEIIFDEVLDITMALQYHEQLNQLLNDQKQITLNAEKIERIDGAGLQLIVAFVIAADKLNMKVTWTGVSEIFKKNANILGVTDILELNS